MSTETSAQFLFTETGNDIFLERLTGQDPAPLPELVADFAIRVPNRTGLFTFKWTLNGSRAYFFNAGAKGPSGSMNLLNSYMELVEPFTEGGVTYVGLRFSKKTTYEELFSPDKVLVGLWFEHLKRFCIRQDFTRAYTLIEQIGSGSFAVVYRAQRLSDKRLFAAKVFNKATMLENKTTKVIQNELNTLREINHPRVVNFIELYESANYVYCITELYFGQSLQRAFENLFPLPEKLALRLIRQVVEAVGYLHARQIIHRDLKLDNVLFKEKQDVIDLVIIDFGFAMREGQEPLLKRCGSLGFVAPEILNDREVDRRADIFSLGAILHKLLPY